MTSKYYVYEFQASQALEVYNVPDSESFYVQTANELCNNFNTIFKQELREKINGASWP